MRPSLMVRWVRSKQIKDNVAHFSAKSLPYDVDEVTNLHYLPDNSVFHAMDIYGPKGSDAVLPVVMVIHGGGYIACEKFINALQAKYLATQNFRVVNINYSLQPEASFIDVVQELFAALHWIEDNAAQYSFDPNAIFVSGDSAGGHYALLVAAVQHSQYLQEYFGVCPITSLKGVAASCPMTEVRSAKEKNDMTNKFLRKNTLHSGRVKDDTFIDNVSIPYLLDKCEFPDVFILTTPTDPLLYEETKQLHNVLDSKGIAHHYREYISQERTLGHVFNVVDPEFPESVAANNDILAYFSQML